MNFRHLISETSEDGDVACVVSGDCRSDSDGERLEWTADLHLESLGRWLQQQDYHFVCPTPETHARVNGRDGNRQAEDLRGIFGWSRPFRRELLPESIVQLLQRADALEECSGLLRSRLRFSSIGERLFMHSAYPTSARDSVFLGPDTYRFADLVQRVLERPWPHPVCSVLDLGCGSGAGAIGATDHLDRQALRRLVLADVNPRALRTAATNCALNDIDADATGLQLVLSDSLSAVSGMFDLIITNPPYVLDAGRRMYCDGGENWGTRIATDFLRDALKQLAPGGRLIVYTGAPIVDGEDRFLLASLPILQAAGARHEYRELDPDVFGEELSLPGYAAVERIAVVGLVAHQ